MSEIIFDHVGKTFPRGGGIIKALDDINLTIGEREFVAVVGPRLRQDHTLAPGRRT